MCQRVRINTVTAAEPPASDVPGFRGGYMQRMRSYRAPPGSVSGWRFTVAGLSGPRACGSPIGRLCGQFWAAIVYGLRHHFVRWQPLPARIALWIRSVLRTPEPRFPDVVFGEATEAPGVAVRRRRVFAWAAAVVLLYAALTLVMTYPQVRVLDRGVSLDIGDPLVVDVAAAWIAHQLPRDPLHLFDANIFYPEPGRSRIPTRCWCRR